MKNVLFLVLVALPFSSCFAQDFSILEKEEATAQTSQGGPPLALTFERVDDHLLVTGDYGRYDSEEGACRDPSKKDISLLLGVLNKWGKSANPSRPDADHLFQVQKKVAEKIYFSAIDDKVDLPITSIREFGTDDGRKPNNILSYVYLATFKTVEDSNKFRKEIGTDLVAMIKNFPHPSYKIGDLTCSANAGLGQNGKKEVIYFIETTYTGLEILPAPLQPFEAEEITAIEVPELQDALKTLRAFRSK